MPAAQKQLRHVFAVTSGATPHLRVRNNGQLAIYRGDTLIVWHTDTHTP